MLGKNILTFTCCPRVWSRRSWCVADQWVCRRKERTDKHRMIEYGWPKKIVHIALKMCEAVRTIYPLASFKKDELFRIK